jgi:hypothetical protein
MKTFEKINNMPDEAQILEEMERVLQRAEGEKMPAALKLKILQTLPPDPEPHWERIPWLTGIFAVLAIIIGTWGKSLTALVILFSRIPMLWQGFSLTALFGAAITLSVICAFSMLNRTYRLA